MCLNEMEKWYCTAMEYIFLMRSIRCTDGEEPNCHNSVMGLLSVMKTIRFLSQCELQVIQDAQIANNSL